MKILLVNHFPMEGSGSGTYTKLLYEGIKARGHEVTLIAPESSEETSDFPCFTSHPKSHRTFYDLSDSEIEHYVDDYQLQMEEIIKKSAPDLIHVGHIWTNGFIASRLGIPYVITSHGTDIKGFLKDKRYHAFVEEAHLKASKIISISNKVTTELIETIGVDPGKIVEISNGFNDKIFHIKPHDHEDALKKLGIEKRYDYCITMAGKLTRFKGVDILLKAASQYEPIFEQLGIAVCTLISGDGILKAELEKEAKALQLKNIYFTGFHGQQQLSEIFNISDLAVFPSRNEPFGLVALEALACGAYIVATNDGGFKDFITPEYGVLVDADDPKQLFETIVASLIPEHLTTEKRKERSLKIRKSFSSGSFVEKTINVYIKVMSEILEDQV